MQLVLSLFLGTLALASGCPIDWIDLGEFGCYHFASNVSSMSWFEGELHCNSLDRNAHLAEIKDIDTQSFLIILLDEINDRTNWWLGATDLYQEGMWRWMRNGEELYFNYWAYGQPDNSRSEEHCLSLHAYVAETPHRYWNDLSCGSSTSSTGPTKPLCRLFEPLK